MSDELTNNAFFTAKPGLSETLGARLLALLAPTRQEPGCTQYEIFRSADHPDASFVYEDWRSQADFQAHMGTPTPKVAVSRTTASERPGRIADAVAVASLFLTPEPTTRIRQ
jgi:quinol monooxygenase YgiN